MSVNQLLSERLDTYAESRYKDAERASEEAEEKRQLAAFVRAVKGTRWVDAMKAELAIGCTYIVRRRTSKTEYQPCVAKWENNGWRQLFGSIPPDSSSGSTVEVWR